MFLETIETPGLAHLSYIVGADTQAAVIDPRRDIDIYLDIARRNGLRIRHIIETHCNEDLLSGSRELAEMTGAEILHGEALDFEYGNAVGDGAEVRLSTTRLQMLHTPGHTDESISVVVYDEESDASAAVAVFTGDTLFVGDVGRTDFYPDRHAQVAGNLHDSLQKLLALGDQTMVLPAHTAGSACGDNMATRLVSTIGYERNHNPWLQYSNRDEFVHAKMRERHLFPPYFDRMGKLNRRGATLLGRPPEPQAVSPQELERRMQDNLLLVDTRSPEAFAGAHVPGSIALPIDLIASYGGWLLPEDRPLGLVVDDPQILSDIVRRLARMGFTNVEAYLANGIGAWETSGRPLEHIPGVSAHTVKDRLERKHDFTVLDVRKTNEVQEARLPGSTHIFLGELVNRLDELPSARPITTLCGSGRRALVAASVLQRAGIGQVENFFGSMAACRALGLPVAST